MVEAPDHTRPSPDALLKAAEREGRGKLKIFLGAAPGVGKTYEMLAAARRRKAEGVDVVAGLVETHGRAETEAQLVGLDVVPRRKVEYKGRALDEMDIDAILKRRPQLVLVDELAHTNAEGSRHPKRYMDVEELLTAGIDVYSTLNVQHIESLNDVVARITRIRVRETVPDRVLNAADEIELVDLTPADLIGRLNEGKVYVREQAQRALRHYFSPGNLTALRELALRRTAERVDEQMLSYMREHAIAGPWAAGERVIVCLDPSPAAANAVRAAKRTADGLDAELIALYVETDRHTGLSEAERGHLAEAMRLAERLGAEIVTLPGRSVVEEILAFARSRNATRVVLGKSQRSRWFELRHGSVVDELVRSSSGLAIEVVSADQGTSSTAPPDWLRNVPLTPGPYLEGTLTTALATAVGVAIDRLIVLPNISLVFVVPVLVAAARHGLVPSLWVSTLGVLCYNFFFLPPLYEFTIRDPANVVALFFFMVVAVVASALAARTRSQTEAARREARTTAELYAFSRKIAGVMDLYDLLWTIVTHLARLLNAEVVILMPDEGRLESRAAFPPDSDFTDADLAAARWSWDADHPTGKGTDTLPGGRWLFVPIRTVRGPVGVIGVLALKEGRELSSADRRILDAVGNQAAIAIERMTLAGRHRQRTAGRGARAPALRHADLGEPRPAHAARLDHRRAVQPQELSRPLRPADPRRASGDGAERGRAARPLRRQPPGHDAARCRRHRAQPGGGRRRRPRIDGAAPRRARAAGPRGRRPRSRRACRRCRSISCWPSRSCSTFWTMPPSIRRTGGRIEIEARRAGERVEIVVRDEGPGISAEALDRIFDKFYRANDGDRRRAGTGLGLAIAKGFVEVQGGTLAGRNRGDRSGAEFVVSWPA